MHTRRNILRAGAATIASGIASPALSKIAVANARSLSFSNLHTGEKLAVEYWTDGQYVPDALSAINHVLRDYRSGEAHAIDYKLLDLLVMLRRQIGSSAPFSVISGYRSPATNKAMHEHSAGVAAHSLHMEGMAIDIRLADCALSNLHDAARAMRAGGVGYYPELDFVHVDVGRIRYWGSAG